MPQTNPQQLNFMDLLEVHQKAFDGPLALLLELIRKQKLEIHNIQLSEICAPYLDYLQQIEVFDFEVAVEFLDLASTLIWIKSRRLLPRLAEPEEEGELLDPEEALRRKLILYEVFQGLAEQLRQRPLLGRDLFTRPVYTATAAQDQAELQFDLSVYALLQAFQGVTSREGFKKPHEITHETKSIEEKILELLDQFIPGEGGTFWDLVSQQTNKSEVILTFMAILELARLKALSIQQIEQFSGIHLQAAPNIQDYKAIFTHRGEALGLFLNEEFSSSSPLTR